MSMNSSIWHSVPVMIQPQTWACWYTSFRMVVSYERGRGHGAGLIDPSENARTQALFTANQGIGATSTEREEIARLLGFQVMYATLTEEGIWDLLRRSPVIYAGRWPNQPAGHWVVIKGISVDTIAINNPAVGSQNFNYRSFLTTYLLQTAERPLIYPR